MILPDRLRRRVRLGLLVAALMHLGAVAVHPLLHLDDLAAATIESEERDGSSKTSDLCCFFCAAPGLPAAPQVISLAAWDGPSRAFSARADAAQPTPLHYLRVEPRGPPAT